MSISIICVTNRPGAVAYLKQQLDKQTFKDFEVIIADDANQEQLYPTQFKPRGKNDGDVWNLNKAYNDCLDKAHGELLVFLQDFIWIPANGLERFWEMYQLYPQDLVTGCGHKYRAGQIVEIDDRCFGDRALVPSDWTYYELNWASCPRSVAPMFDEEMDSHYGGENQIFALNTGRPVWLDRTNECRGEAHSREHDDWETNHHNKNGRLNKIITRLLNERH